MEEFDCNQVSESLRDFFLKHIQVRKDIVHPLEKRTVFQSECSEWLKEHQKRITASNFVRVYFRRQKPSDSMLTCIFKSNNLSNVKSIAHGKAKEKDARTIYSSKMQKQSPHLILYDAGPSVNPV